MNNPRIVLQREVHTVCTPPYAEPSTPAWDSQLSLRFAADCGIDRAGPAQMLREWNVVGRVNDSHPPSGAAKNSG